MSHHLVLSCDGSRPIGSGETCRGWLPLRSASLWDCDAQIRDAGLDLCPSCTRTVVPA